MVWSKGLVKATELVKAKTTMLSWDPKPCNSFCWNTLTDPFPQ